MGTLEAVVAWAWAGIILVLAIAVVRHGVRHRRDERRAEVADGEELGADEDGYQTVGYAMGGSVPGGLVQVQVSGGSYVINRSAVAALTGVTVGGAPVPAAKPKLPVESSTECVVGYRIWPLKRSYPDGYRLTAANAHFGGEITPNEKLTAECKKDAYERPSGIITWAMIAGTATAYEDHEPKPSHPAPDPDCLCGIYAYKEAVPLDPSGQPYAAGEVYLWGRIIEHSDGYRAEFAYPKRLVVVDGGPNASRIADALSLAYGVPCEEWMA